MDDDYIASFQTEKWYKTNRNNFESSVKTKVHFLPNDLIQFGSIVHSGDYYLLKMPKGLRVYHSSRSLFLTGATFPIAGYSDLESAEKNRENILKKNSKCLKENFDECIVNTYYSAPPQTEYLHRDANSNFLGPQIRYAFGLDVSKDGLIDPKFNDRTALKANEHDIGIASYTLEKDTLFLLITDDFLTDLGYANHNLKKLYNNFKKTNPAPEVLEEFSSAAGIYLRDNILYHIHKYPDNDNIGWFGDEFEKLFKLNPEHGNLKIIFNYYKKFYKNISKTNLRNFINRIIKNENTLPGLRMSTFEADKPFHNYVYETFQNSEVQGIIGGNLFNIRFDPKFKNKQLIPTVIKGVFHTELVAFYAPDILKRDLENYNDGNFYLGRIMNEMRKYKTSNILTRDDKNFHQGHLYEHSSWVGLQCLDMHKKFYSSDFADKLYLITGVLHDIGKAGICGYGFPEPIQTFRNFDPHQKPKKYYCKKVDYAFDDKNTEIGFEYYDQPNHPEIGYKMLRGLTPFNFYGFRGDKIEIENTWYSNDFNKFFVDLNGEEQKVLRIAVACHWNYGPFVSKYLDGGSDKAIEEYLRKIEMFYNAEFFKFDREHFLKIVRFIIIISIADIMGSIYHELDNNDLYKIYNEIPNYTWIGKAWNMIVNNPGKLPGNVKYIFQELKKNPEMIYYYYENDENVRNIILKEIDKLSMVKTSELSIQIAKDIAKNKFPTKTGLLLVESFYNIWNAITSFNFQPNSFNNFDIMNTILYSLENLEDVLSAYSQYFPQVIVFDLDSTLFNLSKMWSEGKYMFFNDVKRIIDECQKLRKYGIKLAIASRHYIPKRLIKELKDPNSPIYWANFDLIFAVFTGNFKDIEDYCESLGSSTQECLKLQNVYSQEDCDAPVKNWCIPADYNHDGFILANENGKTVFYDPVSAGSREEKSKKIHMNFLSRYFNIPKNKMILFDDDEFYISGGGVEDTYTAGVDDNGITFDIFNLGIRLFTFDSFRY